MSDQPSLAERFEALAKAATPGPWRAYPNFSMDVGSPKFVAMTKAEQDAIIDNPESFIVETSDDLVAEVDTKRDTEFIAFCGTERDRILEALRIAEVVKKVAESGRCVLDDGTTIVFQFANSQAVASCILGWAAKRGASADG